MLFIKDFRTTATSYNLILEDSETNELSEKVYDFNNDEFGGVENFAALKMLDDINTGKYRLTLSINANNRTAALLSFIKEYKYDKNALIYLLRLYRAKNDGSSEFAKEYYGYYYGKNGEKIYIADYATTGGKSSIITISEKSDKIDDAIVKHHRNLIRKTGELNGIKLRKFNRDYASAINMAERGSGIKDPRWTEAINAKKQIVRKKSSGSRVGGAGRHTNSGDRKFDEAGRERILLYGKDSAGRKSSTIFVSEYYLVGNVNYKTLSVKQKSSAVHGSGG